MTFKEAIHKQRQMTEKHIRTLEENSSAGERYTLMLNDQLMVIFGLICDLGCIIMALSGLIHLSDASALLKSDLFFMVIGQIFTAYLDIIHEKEICTRRARDGSFGLILLSGIIGLVISFQMGSRLYLVGSLLNMLGCLPIYLSFKKGIFYSSESNERGSS